jgi:hypothetical protein
MTLENNGAMPVTMEDYAKVIGLLYEKAGINSNVPLVTFELPLNQAEELFDIFAIALFDLEEEYRETIDPIAREEMEEAVKNMNDIYSVIQEAIGNAEEEMRDIE